MLPRRASCAEEIGLDPARRALGAHVFKESPCKQTGLRVCLGLSLQSQRARLRSIPRR